MRFRLKSQQDDACMGFHWFCSGRALVGSLMAAVVGEFFRSGA
jgi:hypothetical protein